MLKVYVIRVNSLSFFLHKPLYFFFMIATFSVADGNHASGTLQTGNT